MTAADLRVWNAHFVTLALLMVTPIMTCAQCNTIMMSEFVYVKLTFSTLLLTKGSSSSVPVLD